MNVINNQIDLHTAKAAEMFGVPVAEVTSAQRQHAKRLNFCLNYGTSLTITPITLKELE